MWNLLRIPVLFNFVSPVYSHLLDLKINLFHTGEVYFLAIIKSNGARNIVPIEAGIGAGIGV
jgi:hypothetical protein